MQAESSSDFFGRYLLIGDERVEDWFLMQTWWPTLVICILYYVTVNRFMKYMRDRPPFEIRGTMIVYNATMVVLSLYMFSAFIFYGIQSGFNLSCWTLSHKVDSVTVGLAFTFWLYYFSKIIEFLDTMFFVARKKFNLVTVLHVYHHMSMPASTWLAVKYSPGGFMATPFCMNCFIHIFMYSYYALAAAGQGYQKYLWWKKYMTIMQIVQFIMITVHCMYFLLLDCKYSKVLVCVVLGNALIFLSLFSHYYFSSYGIKERKERAE